MDWDRLWLGAATPGARTRGGRFAAMETPDRRIDLRR